MQKFAIPLQASSTKCATQGKKIMKILESGLIWQGVYGWRARSYAHRYTEQYAWWYRGI